MKVVLLGTGNPAPVPERSGPACLVWVEDEPLLFDCGRGTTVQLVRAGIPPRRIRHLFFTHHHYDHNVDYAHFVLARWDMHLFHMENLVSEQLQVYGPEGTQHITQLLFGLRGVYEADQEARTRHPLSLRPFAQREGEKHRYRAQVEAHDVEPGLVCPGPHWQVTAGQAEHAQPYLESLAYRINSDDGAVVITGDTLACGSIRTLAWDADLLIQQCHTQIEEAAQPRTGPRALGKMAREARVKELVLTHIGPHVDSSEALSSLAEAYRHSFGGPVIIGRDLLEISIR